MTEACLTSRNLKDLQACRVVALQNLNFYETLYDSLEDTTERTSIGRAMAQKQSFIGAVEAILKNHEVSVTDIAVNAPANDCTNILGGRLGDHLAQEENFYTTVSTCMNDVRDDLTAELLSHHLKAAELAVTAIKTTSLKI